MNPSRSLAILAMILMFATYGFAQPAGASTPHQGRFDVRDFGATGNGTTLDTQAIQAAINAANKAGGGTVLFLPGTYLSGSFRLLSNVTLDVEAGAVILGSAKMSDYGLLNDPDVANLHFKGPDLGLIYAQDADNIAIVGQGAIDGNANAYFDFTKPHSKPDYDPQYTRQGQAFMDAVHNTTDGPVDFPNGRPGNMIIFYHCSNMLFRDITFRNPPSWTVQIEQIQGAVIDSIHILNDVRIPNNDGVHCIYCHNAHFTNSEIRAGDDSFAIDHSTDVTIDNCTLTSDSSAIRMEDTRDSAFTNLSMHSNRGIGIYDRGKGKTESVVFSNITIDSRLLWGHWWGKGEGIFIAVGEPDGHMGSITRVSFSNIVVDAENGIQLQGTPKGTIGDITFDNVSLRMRIPRPEVQAAVGGNFDTRWTVDEFKGAVFKHDIPAFYAHYVNGLNIHGLDIQWAGVMPAYYTSALDFEDVDNVSIDRFRGRQANVGSQFPVIDLNRVKGISIRDSSALPGSSTFLSANEVTGERLFEGNDLSDAAKSFNAKTSFTMYGNLLPEKKN